MEQPLQNGALVSQPALRPVDATDRQREAQPVHLSDPAFDAQMESFAHAMRVAMDRIAPARLK